MESAIAIIIVILILGIIVDQLFGLADRGIRRRWGLTASS
jgi:NitT/TauT family transport system permease protein